MSKTVVTARIDETLSDQFDLLAAALKRPRSWLVAEAIERYVREESEFLTFVQEGLDDLEAGRLVGQSEVEARFNIRRGDRDAA